MSERQAVEVARLMQGAALDPLQWEAALDAANAFVGGSGIVLLCIETRARFSPCSSQLGALREDYFHRGWYKADPREAYVPLMRRKGIVFDHEVHPAAQIEASDFYQDFLSRHSCKWFAGLHASIGGADWCLALQRSQELGPFTVADGIRLAHLHGALASAAHLCTRIGESWRFGLEYALDEMKQPALLLDCRARVLHRNEAAGGLAGASVDADGGLRFDTAQAASAFEAIFRRALAPVQRRAPGSLTESLEIGGRRYTCRALSLLDQERLIGVGAAVLVVMEPVAADPSLAMRRAFGLTAAETRVALALADGRSVKEIAADHGITENTVRTQLKAIYAKLGVRRQSQLVAFLRDFRAEPLRGRTNVPRV